MKANEFQIGDWVQWNFDVEPKHRQIFSIITEEDSDGNKEYYADLGDGEIYTDLIPISITPEILKKNGWSIPFYEHFDVLSSQYQTPENDICVTLDNIHKELSIRLGDINYSMPKPNHVHELQHALRLCGLSDLADNFKL